MEENKNQNQSKQQQQNPNPSRFNCWQSHNVNIYIGLKKNKQQSVLSIYPFSSRTEGMR